MGEKLVDEIISKIGPTILFVMRLIISALSVF
jgi:hypothetical protein